MTVEARRSGRQVVLKARGGSAERRPCGVHGVWVTQWGRLAGRNGDVGESVHQRTWVSHGQGTAG